MKTKRNTKRNLVVIAIMLALVLTTSFVLGHTGIKRTRAQTGPSQYVITEPPFLCIRRGINGTVNRDTFTTAAFQNNSNNFLYYSAYQIGSLVDSRHGSTLLHQAEEIRVNRKRPIYGGQPCGTQISNVPMLTVFTYGQGATPSHWSNNGRAVNGTQDFVFDFYQNSMIETLRRSTYPQAHVWVASAPIY